jgi:hypothetical protein
VLQSDFNLLKGKTELKGNGLHLNDINPQMLKPRRVLQNWKKNALTKESVIIKKNLRQNSIESKLLK